MARTHASLVALICALIVLVGPASREPVALASTAPSIEGAACVSSVGPGIPPPSSLPFGVPGFHASWYGQSGYATLCAGQRWTATVAFYNSGTFGWVSGRMGEMAFLGAVDPASRDESESALGGTGGTGPDTDWPSPNRAAAQPAAYVGPGQVAWFQFTLEAPTAPGTYRLYVRPVIEGATWMEDQGVFVEVRVPAPGAAALSMMPSGSASGPAGWTRQYTAVATDGACVDLAFVDVADVRPDGSITDSQGVARLSRLATITSVNGQVTGAPFVNCAAVGSDALVRFSISSSVPNAALRPVAFRDLDGDDALDVANEPFALGGMVRVLPQAAEPGERTVVVGVVDLDENYFVDATGSVTYRYDVTDRFERAGTAMTIAWFEQLLSTGDVLAVSYFSDPSMDSRFTFAADLGRQAPAVQVMVDSWDGGPTQNDVGVRLIERGTNVDGIAYVLERARSSVSGSCDVATGAYRALTSVEIGIGSNESTFVDRDIDVGAYCYRVGVPDPLTAQWTYAYAQPLTIANPPTVVAYPHLVDARLVVSAGTPAVIDVGDVIKLAFDKPMRVPTVGRLLLTDADGTVAELRCASDGESCALNTGVETIGDRSYGERLVITLEVRGAPGVVVAGSIAGLQSHATVIAGDLVDVAGNAWDLSRSEDVVVGAPD